MKKLVLAAAVVLSASLFACGGSNDAATENTDTVATENVEYVETGDSVVAHADSVAAPADSAAVEAPAAEEAK